jgi:hypothetical protein
MPPPNIGICCCCPAIDWSSRVRFSISDFVDGEVERCVGYRRKGAADQSITRGKSDAVKVWIPVLEKSDGGNEVRLCG